MKRPSIRKLLVLWTTALTASIIILCGGLLYTSVRKSLYAQLDRMLNDAASVVTIEVEVKNSQVYHEWREGLEDDPHRRANTHIQVWDQKKGTTVRSPALGDHNLPKEHGALGERVFFNLTLPDGRPGRGVGILIHPVLEHPDRDPDFIPADHPQIFVWAQGTENLQGILLRTQLTFIIGTVSTILLLWGVISWITKRSLKPLQNMSEHILTRADNEVSEPIEIPDQLPHEVAGMAETFNTLLSRIDLSREKDRDFFLNIAHEIRTPLAGVQAILELALRQPRKNEDYQRRIEEALSGSRELQQLMQALMSFGRIKRRIEEENIKPHQLSELLEQVWKGMAIKADERKIKLSWKLEKEAPDILTDLELTKVVLRNILDNALTYATPTSVVTLTSSTSAENYRLKIENSIPEEKIPPEELPCLFDPFYRRDKSRSQSQGHTGIGLSFSKEIMELLGGSISVEQSQKHLLSFTLKFPTTKMRNER